MNRCGRVEEIHAVRITDDDSPFLIGLDVKDQLQQVEGDQQTYPSGSVVFVQVTARPQSTGVYPP